MKATISIFKTKTMRVYVPLQDVTDMIDSIDGVPINDEAGDYAANNPSIAVIENDTPTTYPDLVLTGNWDEPPTVVINEVNYISTELLGGAHPPSRPK